ncbi:MAG: sugar transferase [Alphaproteobacteria bacterium]|nr:sugar transferase [Alphaproteobacteria bacterium]
MERTRNVAFRMIATIFDVALIVTTWLAVTAGRHFIGVRWNLDLIPGEPVLRPLAAQHHIGLIVLVLPVWLFCLHRARTYDDLRRIRLDVLLLRIARASGVAGLVLIGITFAGQLGDQLSRTVLIGFTVLVVGPVFLGRVAVIRWLRARLAAVAEHNILIVGSGDDIGPLIEILRRHRQWGTRVYGIVHAGDGEPVRIGDTPVLGTIDELPRVLERHHVDEVMLTGGGLSVDTLRFAADSCEEVGVRFSMDANFLGLSISKAQLSDLDGFHVLTFSATPEDAEALAVKRMMDVLLAGAALLALAPVFLATALAIKLEDGGPVFFGQERSGLFGRPFTMWKFRSMVPDAEKLKEQLTAGNEMDGPVFKMKQDPRITRVGRFIRKTSIDELPQFWNVVSGEMSLVGPRPPLPREVEQYKRWQRRRLSMRPGITCIWQVSGRNNIDFDTWMKLDLQYIDNWSLFLDVRLLARTVPVVLLGTGAS